jgi:hypothetical protein
MDKITRRCRDRRQPQLDFGHSSSIAGDVYQAVECDVGEFGYIVYLTRRFKTASGP